MKTPDFLNALPSVNELLDDPRVRSVADKLNRSVVATRVRGYLDQLAAEAKRRAADAEAVVGDALPESMRDLVDRVSRYLTTGDRWRVGAAINATGRFRGGPWSLAPLADAAVERLLLSAGDFTAAPSPDGRGVAADVLCRASGADSAAVFNNPTAALWAVFASLAEGGSSGVDVTGGEVVVARGDLVTLDGGCRVADLIERTGLRVKEVGAADGATLDDYASAVNAQTAAVLRVAGDDHWPAAPGRIATADLAGLVEGHAAVLIEHVGGAPLVDLSTGDGPAAAAADALSSPSVAETVAARAGITIAAGDGLIGGPACGVVLGAAGPIERLNASPLAPVLSCEPRLASALAATVDLLADRERFWFSVPVWSLLTTPIENLQSRAERLATQLGDLENVAAAEVATLSAVEGPATGLPIRLPTVAVAVQLTGADAERLQQGDPAVWTAATPDGRPMIDLRTLFPRQDGELIEAVRAAGAASPQG